MYDTHTPAEWVEAGCLGLSAISLIALALAFADADYVVSDPRPAARRVLASGHQAVVDAGHTINRALATGQRVGHHAAEHVRRASLRAAISVAALLALLVPATPETTR